MFCFFRNDLIDVFALFGHESILHCTILCPTNGVCQMIYGQLINFWNRRREKFWNWAWKRKIITSLISRVLSLIYQREKHQNLRAKNLLLNPSYPRIILELSLKTKNNHKLNFHEKIKQKNFWRKVNKRRNQNLRAKNKKDLLLF